jgi:glycine oxidase
MRVAVLGGGVIGLATAWRLARAGHEVDLYDDTPGAGASHAGAGMLAPAGEAWFGEDQLVRLGLAGLRQWPAFAARLREASDVDVGLRTEGSLVVGADDADATTLDRVGGLLTRHGIETERLTRRELRRVESALAPGLRRVLLVRSDLSVHNRRVVEALRVAGERAGVRMHGVRGDVDGADPDGATRRTAVRTRDGRRVSADAVVIAVGAELAGVGGLPPGLATVVRPVKGQILRLGADPGLVTHTIRGVVRGDPVYVVPRTDGEVVVGATSEEQGHDVRVTADGVYELLRRAIALVPGLREAELSEALARSRPGTPDNLPLIGPVADGVVVAAGHYRAGFLLAPLTAEAVAAYVEGRPAPEAVGCCVPDRPGFAQSYSSQDDADARTTVKAYEEKP